MQGLGVKCQGKNTDVVNDNKSIVSRICCGGQPRDGFRAYFNTLNFNFFLETVVLLSS